MMNNLINKVWIVFVGNKQTHMMNNLINEVWTVFVNVRLNHAKRVTI